MADVKEKFGMFKDLVGLFDTKGKATMTTILVLAVVYLVWQSGRDKDRLYGMVIDEVRKQVPSEVRTQTAPIRAASDSSKAAIKTYSQAMDTVIKDTRSVLKNLTKKTK